MIKLTLRDGSLAYLSAERIVGVYDGGTYTTIDIGTEEAYAVTESPEEVARKVLEYRLEMARYKAALLQGLKTDPVVDATSVMYSALGNLHELSGLSAEKGASHEPDLHK